MAAKDSKEVVVKGKEGVKEDGGVKSKWDPETLKYLMDKIKCGHQTLAELEKKLAPGFDIKKLTHDHIHVKIGKDPKTKEKIFDTDIAPLMILINTLVPAGESCQYDSTGWTAIDFDIDEFKKFMICVRQRHEQKYGQINDEEDIPGFYQHFTKFHTNMEMTVSEGDQQKMTVIWRFHPDQIQKVTSDLALLFDVEIPAFPGPQGSSQITTRSVNVQG